MTSECLSQRAKAGAILPAVDFAINARGLLILLDQPATVETNNDKQHQ